MTQHKNIKIKGLFFNLLITAFFGASTLFFAWKIVDYLIEERKSRDYWDELQDSVVVMGTEERRDGEAEPGPEAGAPFEEELEAAEPKLEIPEFIDFDRLHTISEDAVAWLYAPSTGINYVVAQAKDNAYYLHRLLDGTYARGGTLFADYRCSAEFTDWNTVIYGHDMKSGTMFSGLTNYRNPDYYEGHPVMYLYLPGERYKLELVAGYTTDIYDRVYSLPASKEERDEVLAYAVGRSTFCSGITVEEEDRLVTLSTCSYDFNNARYVVITRLVKK